MLALAITCLAWATPPPASAHTDLISTNPEAGARLATPPPAVSFTFSDQMSGEFNTVTLVVAGQAPLKLRAAAAGDTITARLPLKAVAETMGASGPVDWTVAYRVVSADGHPVSGKLTFRAPVPEAAGGSPSPSAGSTSADASTPDASAASSDTTGPSEDDAPAGSTGWLLPGAFALVLLVAAGLSGLLVRKRARGGAHDA